MDGIELPGFRFHPTEELLDFYLKNMIYGKKLRFDIIGFLNIYHYDPTDLPGLAKIGEREWYFFVPRDRKHGSGGRPNRTTKKGFWKATGSDRKILKSSDPKRILGLRKTLVFYEGRAPRGCKTDWVMNEYRLPDNCHLPKDVVLCKIYRKATSLKVLEQRAAMEEEMKTFQASSSSSPPSSSIDTITMSFPNQHEHESSPTVRQMVFKQEEDAVTVLEEEDDEKANNKQNSKGSSSSCSCSSLQFPFGKEGLPELQVPKMITDWNLDTNWTLFNSPWLQNLTPNFYANMFSVSN